MRKLMSAALLSLLLLFLCVPSFADGEITAELSQQSVTIAVHGSKKVTVNYSKKGTKATVSWSSSDPSVATVRGGTISAVAAGECDITASITLKSTGEQLQATCHVTVLIPVSSISLATRKVSLEVGEQAQAPEVTITPASATCRELIWASSDPSVATVSEDGVITAVSSGSVRITVKSAQDLTSKPSISMNVTVSRPVKSIQMPSELRLILGQTASLGAAALPEDADDRRLTYRTSDKSVATVDGSGRVTARAAGSCEITATAMDGSGVTAVCSVQVIVVAQELTTGLVSPIVMTEGTRKRILYSIAPTSCTPQMLAWTSTNSQLIIMDDRDVVALKPGALTLTGTTTDGSDLSVSWDIIIEPVNPVVITGIRRVAAIGSDQNCLLLNVRNACAERTVRSFDFIVTLQDTQGTVTNSYHCAWSQQMGTISPGASVEGTWHWSRLTGLTEAARVGITVTSVTFSNGLRETIPDGRQVTLWFE